MFKFFKKNSPKIESCNAEPLVEQGQSEQPQSTIKEIEAERPIELDTNSVKTQTNLESELKESYFSRLTAGLSKTSSGIRDVFLGKKVLDEDLLEEIETALLVADIGVELTSEIVGNLTQSLKRKDLNNTEEVVANLKIQMKDVLKSIDQPLLLPTDKKPFVILMVGINGAGKTTTIGKLTQQLKHEGKTVMLAAGDTFRAAATEQLKTWGERTDTPVISQGTGADAASVIFDAYQSAKAKEYDVLIADTAGRLHTQSHLMSEIEKIVRVLKKVDASAPHEVMLIIDAGNGQNALNQAQAFNDSLNLSGIAVTKLDGTAKGGIVFPIARQLGVPIRCIGVGEGVDDLRPFNANQFVDALLDQLDS